MTEYARDADGIDLIYSKPSGLLYYRGEPIVTAERYHEVNAAIQARRAELRADREYGTPCIVCGAPVLNGIGHDHGCLVAPTTNAHQARREERRAEPIEGPE